MVVRSQSGPSRPNRKTCPLPVPPPFPELAKPIQAEAEAPPSSHVLELMDVERVENAKYLEAEAEAHQASSDATCISGLATSPKTSRPHDANKGAGDLSEIVG